MIRKVNPKAPMASKLLMAVLFIFDLIAFALAVAAEQRRSTVSPLSLSLSVSLSIHFEL